MATRLRRDAQQWAYDLTVKETGKVFHFQGDGRGWLPSSVRQHDMIAKHVAQIALRLDGLAAEAEAAGHPETALELFFEAASTYANAQHTIFENSNEKRLLHARSIRCYDRVRDLAPYPIERLEIPWADGTVYGNLHLLPDRREAPCVVFIPGCDMTKEMYPYPLANQALQRGMHLLSVDGPGQGECNLDGTKLTADNYERAMSAVVDLLQDRPEVDTDAIGIYGMSFGSFWAIRTVAYDHRVRACAGPWASICDKHHLMNVESPRYKQLFAYLTGAESEAELDEITSAMTVDDQLPGITCPTLLTVGEYDPRSPLEELLALYDRMTCDRELWVHADQHHMCTVSGRAEVSERAIWNLDSYSWTLDWLRDRFAGRPIAHSGEVVYVARDRPSPDSGEATLARSWVEAVGLQDRIPSR
jgi:dipeptidyl aminopeptidase/acylaminoacyl peptidase